MLFRTCNFMCNLPTVFTCTIFTFTCGCTQILWRKHFCPFTHVSHIRYLLNFGAYGTISFKQYTFFKQVMLPNYQLHQKNTDSNLVVLLFPLHYLVKFNVPSFARRTIGLRGQVLSMSVTAEQKNRIQTHKPNVDVSSPKQLETFHH